MQGEMRHCVLYVTPWADLYGSSQYLYEMVTRLDRDHYAPLVVLGHQGPLSEKLREANVPSYPKALSVLNRKHRISEVVPFFRDFLPGTLFILQLIRRYRVALVHTNTCHILSGAFAAALAGIPHLWHIHERDVSPAILRAVLSRLVLRLSQKVIAVSEDNKKQFFGPMQASQKLEVISGGVDPSRFKENINGRSIREEFKIGEDDLLIGMVARITPWKGQEQLIESAKDVVSLFPKSRFLLVGDPDVPAHRAYKRKLIHLADRLGIGEKVIFAGFREDIPEILAAFDILVHPVVEPEPFGLVLVEAMAMSKPVIASAVGGPLEIVEDQETGILVPPCAPRELSKAICRLLRDKSLREEMGRKGRQRAITFFTWDKTIARIETTYRKVLSAPGKTIWGR